MDLLRIKDSLPTFLELLRSKGYKESTIAIYRKFINRFLREARHPSINSFEDYYYSLCSRGAFSPRSLGTFKSLLGIFKVYVETGNFYREYANKSGFLYSSSYTKLNDYYKSLIDKYISVIIEEGNYKKTTLETMKGEVSQFCLFFQEHGHDTFESVRTPQQIWDFFNDGNGNIKSYSYRKSAKSFLSSMAPYESTCRFLLSFLPIVPSYKKNHDFLNTEEKQKIEICLSSTKLNLRDKAIGIIAYYTGLRRSDIANLTLDDFDLERNLIVIPAQQKTGVPLTIPLRPIVRDAICEYVEKERPKSDEQYVFLTEKFPHRGLCPSSFWRSAHKIMEVAGIRANEKRGLHLFRRAFATDLISKEVPNEVVSKLLGHASSSSLEYYLDTDIEHLRSCSLSIEKYVSTDVRRAKMAGYHSRCADVLTDITLKLCYNDKAHPYIHRTLCLLDDYCLSMHPNSILTQDIIDEWSYPMKGESHQTYQKRMWPVKLINMELSRFGLSIKKKNDPEIRKKHYYSKSFVSACGKYFEEYVAFRQISQRWNSTYDMLLRSFDKHCYEHSIGPLPTQEAIDGWAKKRENEQLTSCGRRVAFFSGLCQYLNSVYGTCLKAPDIPGNSSKHPMLYDYSEVELENLFIACDNLNWKREIKSIQTVHIIIPAMIRLMFSSGLRTKEVRMLDCEDVELMHGVINIRKTKGINEHRIALHPSMREYLMEYNHVISAMLPRRKCFFRQLKTNTFLLRRLRMFSNRPGISLTVGMLSHIR